MKIHFLAIPIFNFIESTNHLAPVKSKRFTQVDIINSAIAPDFPSSLTISTLSHWWWNSARMRFYPILNDVQSINNGCQLFLHHRKWKEKASQRSKRRCVCFDSDKWNVQLIVQRVMPHSILVLQSRTSVLWTHSSTLNDVQWVEIIQTPNVRNS